MVQAVTVAGWNLNGWHTITDAQLALLDEHGAQLVVAQEVTVASLQRLRAAGWQAAAALELVEDGHVERAGARPRFGCAVLARGAVALDAAGVLADAPSPVRTLAVDVTLADHRVHVVSAASPPGSRWGRAAKVGQARRLADHLWAQAGPVLLGIDRNGPNLERFEPDQTVWWPEDDPALFAPDAAHGLTDVLHTYFTQQPGERERARRQRPGGPLAVSYLEHRARPPVARRYDVVMASHHWQVRDVACDFDRAVAAGSDHALLRADLTLHG